MHKLSIAIRRGVLYVTALVLVAGYPTAVMADTLEPVTEPTPTVTTTEIQPSTLPEEEQDSLTYTYDAETNKWNSEEWEFNPESGTYEKPPTPIIIEPPVTETTENPAEKSVDTTVEVDTIVSSTAASGDAAISSNTTAGSALTGDADAVATIINAVNSSIAADTNQKVATFTQDITGDVKGDIILYPLLLKAMLEAEAQEGEVATINSTTDLNINNDITLNALSGDATVDSNTTAGDAETGNATAMANVVNILNSLIAAQDSFIGTINIYGSLEGDILIAPDFIPQLIANNGTEGDSTTQLSTLDTTTIVNNISAVAESGAASVFGNTSAGSATTGSADSSVVIFNVTGHDIVAENSMLVFVNVLGTWVGMIIDAPGATAAMIGSGVTDSSQYTPDIVVDAVTKHGITNTIAVNAETGDAVVSNNTSAGNATSGNANALVNVANVSNSSLSLTGWFGVLFINITGDWFGSFQVNTPFGNPVATPAENQPQPSGPVQFIPEQQRTQQSSSGGRGSGFTIIDSRVLDHAEPTIVAANVQTAVEESAVPEVKGATTNERKDAPIVQSEPNDFRMLIALGTIIFTGASIAWVRRAM